LNCNRCDEWLPPGARQCPECALPIVVNGAHERIAPPGDPGAEDAVQMVSTLIDVLGEAPTTTDDADAYLTAAVPALVATVRDRSNSEGIRRHAAALLADIGHAGPDVVAALVELLEEDSKRTRLTALAAIGALGADGADAIPSLVRALRAESRLVRAGAAEALGEMGAAARPAAAALAEAIESESKTVRAAAAMALAAVDPDAQISVAALADDLGEGDIPMRLAIDALPMGVALLGSDGLVVRTNITFRRLAENVGMDVNRQIQFSPLARKMVKQFSQWNGLVAGTCARIHGEARFPDAGGEEMWLNAAATAVRTAGGRFCAVVLTLEDSTDRRRADEATDRLRAVIEGARCLLWQADITRRVDGLHWRVDPLDMDAAQAFLPLDLRPDEPWHYAEYRNRHPDDKERMDGHADRVLMAGGTAYTQAFRSRARDGSWRWLYESVSVTRRSGNEWRAVGFWTDITQQKAQEAELRALNTQLEQRVRTSSQELHATAEQLQRELTERRRTEDDLRKAEAERSSLLRRILAAQEDERARIASELHERTGQVLSSVSMGLTTLTSGEDEVQVARRAETLRDAVNRALRDVRELAVHLRPTLLDHFGLVSALEQDLRILGGQIGIAVDFHSDLAPGDTLADSIGIAAYRIAQGALANVARHARARTVGILMRPRPGYVQIVIEDDGVGFDLESVMSGPVDARFGLLTMQERAAAVGGRFAIESSPGSGTTVYIDAPRDPDAASRRR
jgi:signal transduction histidine kinase